MTFTFKNPYQNSHSDHIPSLDQDEVAEKSPGHKIPTITVEDEHDAWEASKTIPRVRTGGTLVALPIVKTLEFRKRLFNSNLHIWNKTTWDETPEYFAACTEWGKRPDVTLHKAIAGQEEPGAVLGVSYFRHSCRNFRLGIGDAVEKPSEVAWERMRNTSKLFKRSKYEWEFTEAPDWKDIENGTPLSGTRRFKWTRTVDVADGVEHKLCLRNFRLVDEDTEALVAIFVASGIGTVRKRGELRIYEELRPKVEIAVVLTCASISVKLSRD